MKVPNRSSLPPLIDPATRDKNYVGKHRVPSKKVLEKQDRAMPPVKHLLISMLLAFALMINELGYQMGQILP